MLSWLVDLRATYGMRLLVMIFCAQHLLKGFVAGGGSSGLVGAAMDYIYRGYHVTGPRLQTYSAVALIPWSIKALTGLLSDSMPIFGFHKSPYICISSMLAAVAYIAVALQHGLPLSVLTGCFFMIFLQISWCDTMVEAKYSEKVKRSPEKGPDLCSFVWTGNCIGHLLSTALAGIVIDFLGAATCYLFALPFACFIIGPTGRNFLEEEVVSRKCCKIGSEALSKQKPIIALALAQGVSGLSLALFSLVSDSSSADFLFALVVGAIDLLLFSLLCRPIIAKMNAYFFMNSACNIGIHGAAFYFFTDDAKQYPEGPHFSASFYVTAIGVMASGCNILGMIVYVRWGKHWRYRSIFAVSSVVSMSTQVLNVFVFSRLNKILSIPDWLFMVCSSALQNVISQFAWMPGTVMLAQLVPDGLESTMYALLGGSWNLGMSLANFGGAWMLDVMGVSPSGAEAESEQFANLWLAALIAALGPCVVLLLVPVLVPDACQTDTILEGNAQSAVVGSLWERCHERCFVQRYSELEKCQVVTSSAIGANGKGDASSGEPSS